MRSIVYTILLAIPAHAQFYDFLANWSYAPPSDTRAFEATVTSTLKARTPWGEMTTVETGKYWRSSDGRDRYDNAYGSSTFRDRRGPILQVRIDHQLRLLEIEENVAALRTRELRLSSPPPPPKSRNPLVDDPWDAVSFALAFAPRNAGQKTVEGLKVAVRKGSDHEVNYEVWASDELGILLFAQYKTDRTVFEQRIHDIRFVEPDSKLLELPRYYRTHITCWLSAGGIEAPIQTYEPGRSFCPGVPE